MADDRLAEVLLVAEVVVEQPARDPGLLGQDVDRDLLERPGGEQPDAEVEQLDAALVRGQPDAAGVAGASVTSHHSIDACSITPIRWRHDAALAHLGRRTSSSAPASPASAWRSSSQEAGETDFLVIEKGADVGGTWRDNTYPGAACDVPSQLYSFSFAPNPDWSRSFSPQPEIQAYLRRVAARVRRARPVRASTPRSRTALGRRGAALAGRAPPPGEVTADHADHRRRRALRAAAARHRRHRRFGGELFHSARWDHDVDLTGKRVAVIGTGASAIQIVPEVQRAGRATSTSTSAPRRG